MEDAEAKKATPPPPSSPSPTLPSASASASTPPPALLLRPSRQPSRSSSPRYFSSGFCFFLFVSAFCSAQGSIFTLFPLQESPVAAGNVEPLVVDDSLSIYKGRVNTCDVFGVKNSDLVPGKYEGGLKLWEGSLDLVKTLNSDIKAVRLLVEGKQVLELGCGHGLPGIFAGLKGAGLVHFQDFNAEVLRCLTIPNVKANLFKESSQGICTSQSVGFYAGDWSEIDKLLLCGDAVHDKTTNHHTENEGSSGYDIILMAETVYALDSLPSLYRLIKKCLRYPGGVVYMAGKKHYFGVGGGTRQFLRLVTEDGAMQSDLLAEVTDGSSNVREVWKFSFK
ncbi:hypothetical protein ACQ4PT_050648 [Festuca glaucescens]